MNIDEVLQQIGEFGRYQWLFGGMISYVSLNGAFAVMIVSFITAEPGWVCVKGYNSSICNFTEPITLTSKHYKARCDMPREAWSYVEEFTSTVTEFDLVCEKSVLQSVAQSCFWLGMFFGLIIGGYLSDKFGRRMVYYGGFSLIIVTTWIMVFPKYLLVFIAGRILVGFGYGLYNGCNFILLAEYTTVKYRARMGWMDGFGLLLGTLVLSLMAYYIRSWRMLLLATAALTTPVLCIWWILPESTRWLMLNGKEEVAKAQLKKVAKINGKPFPDFKLNTPPKSHHHVSFKQLFHNWQTRKTTLISWNLWFTAALVFYGVWFGSVDLDGDKYLNFALSCAVDFPSSLVKVLALDRIGRKRTVIIGLLVAFIAAVVSASIPSDSLNPGYNIGRVFSTVVAKFFISMTYGGVYLWTTELFPTTIRSKAFSTSSAAGRVGSFSASYIIWLIRVNPLLPYGIMAIICLQAAIFACFLPETNNKSTLETMNDMIERKPKPVLKYENEVADSKL